MGDEATPARADVKPGDKVAGYTLEEQIGQGGMAVVYRAYDERLDRRVALKVLSPLLAADAAFRTRFIRESRAAAAVDHPNIIPVYDAGDAGGCLFISMRYVQGGDVRSLIADGTALPPARAWNIISQVASALDAAHDHNLVHRDVKPANMLLDASSKDTKQNSDPSGQAKEHVYLSDFGISKQSVASNLTSTGQFVGTLDYIAPEQIENRGIDGRADQYSLGCAAYELLSGTPPFNRSNGFALINSHLSEHAPPITTIRPELPQALNRVLGKAMAKAPAQRYASCAQFSADLGRALGFVPGALEADSAGPADGGAGRPHPMTELASPGLLASGAPTTNAPAGAAAGVAAAGAAAGWSPGAQGTYDPATMYAAPGQSAPQPMQAGMASGQQAPPMQPGTMQPGTMQPGTMQPGTMQPGQPGQQWQGGWPAGQQPGYGQFAPYQTYPQPGVPGGPTGPGWQQFPPQQPAPPPKRNRGLLIGGVAGALVVAVAAGAFAVTALNKNNSPSPTPSPTPSSSSPSPSPTTSSAAPASGRAQATTLNHLLLVSQQSRAKWNNSALVGDVAQCVNIGYDVSQIQQIANQRAGELSQAMTLQYDAIPNGSLLKSQLVRALRTSLTIDNDYLAWARQQSDSNCTVGTNSSYYDEASSLNSTATSEKQTFVNTWYPVANQYGLNQFQASDI